MNIKVGNKNLRLLSYNTDDKLYSNCIFFYWACSIANAVIKRALGGSMRATLVSAAICFPVFLAFAVKAVLVLYRQKRIKTLLIPAFFFCCAFIISAFRGVPVSVMPIMIMWGILGIFLGSVLVSIEDYSVLYYEFHRGITLLIIISLIGLLVANRSYYMMHFSYLLVLPCCVSFLFVLGKAAI